MARSSSFDGLGRVTYATQTTNGHPYTFSFCPNGLSGYTCIGASGYNLIDEVTSMTLPSGTAVTNTYDAIGRPSGVSAQAASLAPVSANNASFTPSGSLQQLSLGNGLTEQTCYNDHQQPFVIRQRFTGATSCSNTGDTNDMGYLAFTFPGGNNGNVASQTIQYGATPHGANPAYPAMSFTQNYAYDQANRLASVQETSSANWSQYFGYDAVGNRWLYSGAQFDASTPVTGSINPFDANNHLNSAGYADGRGNQTGDGGYGFQYDEENRLVSSSMSGSTLATYTYDADGHRVMKVAGAETTVYVYNPQGELAAEYSTGASTTSCATTCYLMTDHLGSTRMQTDANGNQIQLFDYAPFGEGLGSAGGRDGRWAGYQQSGIHFTGKEQEGFEGAYMHYFGARYFSGGLGRFTSVDPSMESAILELPQTWNRYSYVYNRPLFETDPDGRCPPCVGAIVGGVVEAGWNLGTQLYHNGGSFRGVAWGEVGANFAGGAVAGGLAVLTGGASIAGSALLGDAAAGAFANGVGGIVTRVAEGRGAQEAFHPQDMLVDAVAGFVGGAGGHLAADAIHIPEEPALPGPRRHAVGRRKLADNDMAVKYRQLNLMGQAGLSTAAASAPAHGVAWINANFWAYLNWLVMAHQPAPGEPQACVETNDSATGTITRSCN